MFQGSRSSHVALLALTLVIAACSSAAIVNSWKDPEYTGPSFRKVLVLGIARDAAARRTFEDTFAKQLEKSGIAAIPAYRHLPEDGVLPQEKIKEVVKREGIDGILITQVKRVERRTEVRPGTIRPAVGLGWYGYYSTAWVAEPPTVYQYEVATLQTSLWQAGQEKLVWSATTNITEPSNISNAVRDLSEVLVKELTAQKLI